MNPVDLSPQEPELAAPTALGRPGAEGSGPLPLYVDLDGTLVRTDLLLESSLALLKSRPGALLQMPAWLRHGKAGFKSKVAQEVDLAVTALPYNRDVLDLIARARRDGRRVVLATASHQKIANAVAAHLGVFDAVLATNAGRNCAGAVKLAAIREDADGPFCYAGNAKADLPIWAEASGVVAVSSNAALLEQVAGLPGELVVIRPGSPGWRDLVKEVRLHQWIKNMLVFMPAVPVAKTLDGSDVWMLILAFVCFSCCASCVYVLNDLLDLDADRQHTTKRLRPVASGTMSLSCASLLAAALLAVAIGIAITQLPWMFSGLLAAYWVLTLAYSLRLKRATVVDVLLLAGLYTMRILAGATVIGVMPSFWILAFSMFLFFSLASAKRYIELADALEHHQYATAGRGYNVDDLPILLSQGVAAGQIAVLVFALYIHDPVAADHFSADYFLWGIALLLLYWISRLWMNVVRSRVQDDPVVFALKDRQSRIIALLCCACLWAAL